MVPDKFIQLLDGDAEIVATGTSYTRIFMCFAPIFMWNHICNAFVRNDGNPSVAMAATLCSSLFNIVFDYVLMFPLGLAMPGAALATAFSPVVGVSAFVGEISWGVITVGFNMLILQLEGNVGVY